MLSRLLVGMFVVLISACRPAESIETYTVPAEKPGPRAASTEPAEPTPQGEPTDRMLAAILPVGEKAWFLKVVGPVAQIDPRAEEIAQFFASLQLAQKNAPPKWELPEGWTEKEGAGMRAATLMLPTEGDPLELSVIGLPWRAGASPPPATGSPPPPPAALLSNINRWRGQLQMPPITAEGLADCTQKRTLEETSVTVVDLRGWWKSSGMGPFMGRPGAGMAKQPGAGTPRLAAVKFAAPGGWDVLPAGGIRKAAYRLVKGDREAMITVIDFPADAGPVIADPLSNVNRWRGEIGQPPISSEELAAMVETIQIDGQEGSYIPMISEGADRAILATMVENSGRIWFFKMIGDHSLVAEQQETFRNFLQSVQW